MRSFNINNQVMVRLTQEGKDRISDINRKLREVAPMLQIPDPTEDEGGYSKWQLHSLMEIFGPGCYVGGPSLFESNEIFFEDDTS